MSDQQGNIIIKKIKKVSGGGHHGGSWKVAYADFVTAMMAFFLLLWLITMVSPEKRPAIAAYFKYFSIFESSGTSFLEHENAVLTEPSQSEEKVEPELEGNKATLSSNEGKETSPETFQRLLKQAIEKKLGDIKDQIIVDTFKGGVRIQLVDKEGKPMFDLGSAKPTPLALRILRVIAENIKSTTNPISIEGHTDSLAYKTSNYSNWELSTERALTTRKIIEQMGIDPSRLKTISGYADTEPLIPDNPKDPRNRRISILLYFPKTAAGTDKTG
ncbi:flagellar motor protein MotB [Dissulfurimicrobium hydrothermale]|uniref:flagellar motor protein MotB n=1 Tax=Dissulfurimicrobium hydrothermale TaxID=1750598 RepID=UPI001EDBEF19|nr:flagellar motor protein MotB [Dissulfurimicrobium hydrothermale]UKL13650.1 OmpA family protein [Dissulfurimicrobium hydrothermale]